MESLEVIQLSTTLRGTITGTIKNTCGAPVPGITVTALVDGGGQGQLTTTSTATGTYTFSGLDVGNGRLYSLRFTDPAGTYQPLDYDADASTPAIDLVKVVAGATTTANPVLRRYATMAGSVHDTAGAALQGITVTARPDGGTQGQLTATTAADGSYSFKGLDVGTGRPYALSFSDPAAAYLPLDYDADPATPAIADMVTVAPNATTSADAVLRRSCTISGAVTDSRTGQSVAGVRVEAVPAAGQAVGSPTGAASGARAVSGVTTDAAGKYTLPGVPEGTYLVLCHGEAPVYGLQYWPAAQTADAATPITLTPSAPAASADVVLHHDDTQPATAALNSVKMRRQATATLKFKVTDAYGDSAKLTLVVATTTGKVKARVQLGVRRINAADSTKWKPGRLVAGKYTWWITATDLAGNAQSSFVRKKITLTP